MGALVAITFIWGVTFVLIKSAIRHIPPLEFLSIRFLIASLLLTILMPRSFTEAVRVPRIVIPVGAALAAGYAFQTIGLLTTGATKSSLITGMFVVVTPLMGAIALRAFPKPIVAGGALLAAGGLFLLTTGPNTTFNRGDAITLLVPFAFAVHILLMGSYARKVSPAAFASGQMAVAFILLAAASVFSEALVLPRGAEVWVALIVTAVGASALAFVVMAWAQRVLSPTQAAVVCTMEPVFATACGVVVLSERLSVAGWVGAALIVGATLLVAVGEPDTAQAEAA